MWSWLKQLFAGGSPSAPKPLEEHPATPPLRVIQGGKSLPPFEHFLQLQGRIDPSSSFVTPDDLLQDEELAGRVLSHFRQNRPGPSSLPAVSLQILNAVADSNTSLAELSRLISQDPAMSAGVLKVANSPIYRGTQEIDTLRDAVTRLGLAEVGRVAGIVAARSLFQSQMRAEFAELGSKWNEIFGEAVVSARLALWLALRVNRVRGDHVFLAALLHDLGRSVGLRSIASLSAAGPKIDVFDGRIDRVLERVHVEIGAEVHEHWHLPRFPLLVTMRHHDLNLPSEGEYRDVHLVRLCSAMVQLSRQPWRFEAIQAEVNESCKVFGLDGYELRLLETQMRDELQKVATLFAEKTPVSPPLIRRS